MADESEVLRHFPFASFRPGQKDAILKAAAAVEEGKKVMLNGPTGCHAAGQGILMHDGSTKKVEDVVVGDRLMGPDGVGRAVLQLIRGTGPMVTVIPDTGHRFTVTMDHVLTLQDPAVVPGRQFGGGQPGGEWPHWCRGRVVDVSVADWLQWTPEQTRRYRLVRMKHHDELWQLFEDENRGSSFTVAVADRSNYYGFTLDGDGRYLMDDFTVTHNSGKSGVAIALARWSGSALVTTPLNSLVDQYARDFGDASDVAVLKGRCYSDDTEVLTNRGWSKFGDVDVATDYVATRSESGRFEWQRPTDKIDEAYSGKMYHFWQRNLDMVVTPGHRMLVSRRRERKPEVMSAKDVFSWLSRGNHAHVPTTSAWDGPDTEWVPFESREHGFGGRGGRKAKFEGMTGDDFAAFMGMYLSEGCVVKDMRGKIVITQMPTSKGWQSYHDALQSILGCPPYFASWSNQFLIYSVSLWEYLAPMGKSWEKYVPREILSMSRRQLRIFWRFYNLGDGSFEERSNGPTRERITTSSPMMADGLQEVAQKIGFNASICEVPIRNGGKIRGRPIRSVHPVRGVGLLRTRAVRIVHFEEVDYVGRVYCLTVPNGTLFVRRNRKAQWCGNSNYPCTESDDPDATAEEGVCVLDRRHKCQCPYAAAKAKALTAPVVVTNLAMASVSPTIRHLRKKDFRLLVIDETHNLESAVLFNAELRLWLDEYLEEPPDSEMWEDHAEWIREVVAPEVHAQHERAKEILAQYERRAPPDKVRRFKRWRNLAQRIDGMTTFEDEPWVPMPGERVDGRNGTKRRHIDYRPLSGHRFLDGLFYSLADSAVLMSATLPLPEEVGLEDPVMIDVPMSFPAANRPIIMEPCGKMSLAHRAETTVVAAEVIRMLAKGRSIIHAHSYGVASSLSKELHRLGVPHVLQDGGDREGSLNGWIEGDVPIYVSVNMGEGISLDDDKCRTNFILKMPFPFLGDPWVQARNRHLGNDWAMPAVARAICQALGRSTRSESDWSSAYVLDSDFLWFYRAWSHAFPPWFREAVGLPPATGPAAAKEAV